VHHTEKARFNGNVPQTCKALVTENQGTAEQSIIAGMGMGFYPEFYAGQRTDLVEIFAPQPDWMIPLWIVTHVDLHRSTKVQAVLKHLKEKRPQDQKVTLAQFVGKSLTFAKANHWQSCHWRWCSEGLKSPANCEFDRRSSLRDA
jgi:hypothetical protein